ncbi:DUF2971 domain-containing protein [Rugamonas sp. FT107W]|uniref:DUF2971 domain-containing protein n=2 Tax=Duganella vulcania TaxID=2692166 RepID=A0A845HB95_9BURK|nr:DUF2971 domain-containing protein [Duganella vulcania]
MRVWHFVNEQYGLENIRRRRLKIATLNELNDPFDFLGVNLGDDNLRRAFRVMKDELAQNRGILCFSRDWTNPVQWSHYADKHKGLCLGFEIPDELLGAVSYSRKRLVVETEALRSPRALPPDIVTKLLFTKYSHWRYENEVRCFVNLDERDADSGLYFADFADNLELSAVVVGAQSSVSRKDLSLALGDLQKSVKTVKARLAFSTFKVVQQRKAVLWP